MRSFFQVVRYFSRIDCRSRAAESGGRFVQKYCNAFRPTTGMPFSARTFDISLSIFAQPPSPDTNTTSVSEAPFVAGTSTRGRLAVATAAARKRESIGRGIEQLTLIREFLSSKFEVRMEKIRRVSEVLLRS